MTNDIDDLSEVRIVTLTEEQHTALDLILNWLEHQPITTHQTFKLGGYAGTGKTTLLKFLLEILVQKGVSSKIMAFTGKACNVLRRKELNANTIHSTIYDCHQDPTTKQWHFDLRRSLPSNPDLLIVDEASMLSTDLLRDLLTFKKKVLFVGDPGQLEPVGDNPNLMAKPDFVLSKIHRQAEKSPIILLASNVRLAVGGTLTHRISECGSLVIRNKNLTPSEILEHSQCIVARNKTRNDFNTAVRRYQRRNPLSIEPEDKIIVLKNNLDFGVFNGMILFVDEIVKDLAETWRINAHDEVGEKYIDLNIWKLPFVRPELFVKKSATTPVTNRKMIHADYAYAITCHKSQGSEWDSVVVYDEWMPPSVWDMARWRYTAITRAAKKLSYLI